VTSLRRRARGRARPSGACPGAQPLERSPGGQDRTASSQSPPRPSRRPPKRGRRRSDRGKLRAPAPILPSLLSALGGERPQEAVEILDLHRGQDHLCSSFGGSCRPNGDAPLAGLESLRSQLGSRPPSGSERFWSASCGQAGAARPLPPPAAPAAARTPQAPISASVMVVAGRPVSGSRPSRSGRDRRGTGRRPGARRPV
jgi:hypothetical protein